MPFEISSKDILEDVPNKDIKLLCPITGKIAIGLMGKDEENATIPDGFHEIAENVGVYKNDGIWLAERK